MTMSSLLPGGVERFLTWRRRFEELGFSKLAAVRAAADRELKRAYVRSRIEHLPASLRRSLRVVVDVGANEGQWLGALLAQVTVERVEAFEPNPVVADTLQASLARHAHVRLHRVAAGSTPGTLPLQVTAASDFASFKRPEAKVAAYYAPGATEVTSEVDVQVVTLDDALRDLGAVDLLKIDAQGFEREVLAGARGLLRRTRAILIEANYVSHYQGDESLGSLTELLATEGFTLWDLSPPHRAKDGRALWCDAVFVRAG
jgi:FkbM family methyltransferase